MVGQRNSFLTTKSEIRNINLMYIEPCFGELGSERREIKKDDILNEMHNSVTLFEW